MATVTVERPKLHKRRRTAPRRKTIAEMDATLISSRQSFRQFQRYQLALAQFDGLLAVAISAALMACGVWLV